MIPGASPQVEASGGAGGGAAAPAAITGTADAATTANQVATPRIRCARHDSNVRPLPPQGSALSPELRALGSGQCSRAPCAADASSSAFRRELTADVRERAARTALVTRPTTLPSNEDLGPRLARRSQHAQAAVRVPAVVQPGDRFLAGIAALGEGDMRAVETRLGRKDRLVDLLPPCGTPASMRARSRSSRRPTARSRHPTARRAGKVEEVPQKRATDVCSSGSISHFAAKRARSSAPRTVSPSPGSVRSRKSSCPTPEDPERRDDPPFRRQQQRVARRLCDIVREHPLQEILRVGAAHGHEIPGPFRDSHRELV